MCFGYESDGFLHYIFDGISSVYSQPFMRYFDKSKKPDISDSKDCKSGVNLLSCNSKYYHLELRNSVCEAHCVKYTLVILIFFPQ